MKSAFVIVSSVVALHVMLPASAQSIAGNAMKPTAVKSKTTSTVTTTKNQPIAGSGANNASKTAVTTTTKTSNSPNPIQGGIKKKGKLKSTGRVAGGASNPYSITKPYNPNNPPPIDNKIHPVSSNAR